MLSVLASTPVNHYSPYINYIMPLSIIVLLTFYKNIFFIKNNLQNSKTAIDFIFITYVTINLIFSLDYIKNSIIDLYNNTNLELINSSSSSQEQINYNSDSPLIIINNPIIDFFYYMGLFLILISIICIFLICVKKFEKLKIFCLVTTSLSFTLKIIYFLYYWIVYNIFYLNFLSLLIILLFTMWTYIQIYSKNIFSLSEKDKKTINNINLFILFIPVTAIILYIGYSVGIPYYNHIKNPSMKYIYKYDDKNSLTFFELANENDLFIMPIILKNEQENIVNILNVSQYTGMKKGYGSKLTDYKTLANKYADSKIVFLGDSSINIIYIENQDIFILKISTYIEKGENKYTEYTCYEIEIPIESKEIMKKYIYLAQSYWEVNN